MRALHVVRKDLELRLGVDLRPLGQQQRVVGLLAIRLLRFGMDVHLAIEDAVRRAVEDALVQLPAVAVGLHMFDARLVVDVLVAVAEVEAVQRGTAAFAAQLGVDVRARERRARGKAE